MEQEEKTVKLPGIKSLDKTYRKTEDLDRQKLEQAVAQQWDDMS